MPLTPEEQERIVEEETFRAQVHSALERDRRVRQWKPGVAAVLSLFIPGAGQIYKGQTGRGLLWLVFTIAGYAALVVPGIILHVWCIFSAASANPTEQSNPLHTESNNTVSRVTHVVGGVLIGVAIILAAISSKNASGPRNDSPSASRPVSQKLELRPSIRTLGVGIIVRNGNSFDWSNVRLTGKDGRSDADYLWATPRLAAGETVRIPYSRFTSGDRRHARALREFTLICSNDDGRVGSWKGLVSTNN